MLYKAKIDGDIGVKTCKIIGRGIPLGFEKTADFFVDNSGLGDRSEPALVFVDFLAKVKAGRYYAITEVGQFQVYIAEFIKISKKVVYEAQGIARSRLVSKSCRVIYYLNGDKTIRLYTTDIVQFKGNKITLNANGYQTVTTKARMNEFLPVGIRIYQKAGVWYIDDKGKKIEFFDGIELEGVKK